ASRRGRVLEPRAAKILGGCNHDEGGFGARGAPSHSHALQTRRGLGRSRTEAAAGTTKTHLAPDARRVLRVGGRRVRACAWRPRSTRDGIWLCDSAAWCPCSLPR